MNKVILNNADIQHDEIFGNFRKLLIIGRTTYFLLMLYLFILYYFSIILNINCKINNSKENISFNLLISYLYSYCLNRLFV